MNENTQGIEKLRAQYETRLMATEGVVSVSTGRGKGGEPRLKVGTSVPPEQVRPQLPEGLPLDVVELEYIGDVRAQ